MLDRVWVFTTAAVALLAFTSFAHAQAIPSRDGLMRIPEDSAPDSTQTGISRMRSSISGSVHGEDDSPIGDAKIEIRNVQSGQTAAYGYTGSGGRFELSNLAPGDYDVIATSGLSETHEQVRMDGSPIRLTIRLSRRSNASPKSGSIVSVQQLRIPGKAQSALEKAQNFLEKGKPEQAREQIAKALSVDPTYSDAIALRGIMALQDGDTDAASNDLQQAIQMDNNNAMAYTAMGSIYNSKNRYDDAQRELQRAQSINPTLWQTHYELSKAQLGKGDYAGAIQEANRAQALLGRSFGPLHVVKGQILLGMKAFSNAIGEFQKFLDEDKDNPAAPRVRELMDRAKLSANEHN